MKKKIFFEKRLRNYTTTISLGTYFIAILSNFRVYIVRRQPLNIDFLAFSTAKQNKQELQEELRLRKCTILKYQFWHSWMDVHKLNFDYHCLSKAAFQTLFQLQKGFMNSKFAFFFYLEGTQLRHNRIEQHLFLFSGFFMGNTVYGRNDS